MFESMPRWVTPTKGLVALRKQFKNPYSSPRVINALIEEIIDQASTLLMSQELTPDFVVQLQAAVDDVSHQVQIKGVALTRLIAINVEQSSSLTGTVDFHLKPLCEDGKYLLKRIEEYRTPDPTTPPLPLPLILQGKKITRIVEI